MWTPLFFVCFTAKICLLYCKKNANVNQRIWCSVTFVFTTHMNVFGVNEVDLFTRIYAYSVSMENFGTYVYVRIWASQKVSWTTHIYVFGSKEVKTILRCHPKNFLKIHICCRQLSILYCIKLWETVFSIFVAKSILKAIFFSLSFTHSMETDITYNDN